jgi:hypothetical protein
MAILTLAVLLASGPLAPQADAQTRVFRFQTPSRNIGCLYSSATGRPSYLRCDILSGVKPRPRRACQLDWVGFSMNAASRATATCAGDTVYARGARVFPYAWTWTRGGFTCTVGRAGLRCRNGAGRGFFLSKARSYAF